LADIFPLHYASSRYFYAQLKHHNANSTSIYNAVNEFLEVVTTEKTKFPQPLTNKKSPPGGGFQNLDCAKEVCHTFICQVKGLLSLNTYQQKSCLTLLFSKKMEITIPFLPPNLKEMLEFTPSCVKNG